MALTYEEAERLINEIVSGRKIVEVGGNEYCFRFPSREDKFWADRMYQKKLLEMRKKEILTEEEILEFANAQSIYTKEDENELRKLSHRYNVLLEKARENPGLNFSYQINEIKKRIERLSQKKQYVVSHSADYFSERYRINCLLCTCTENICGEPIWDDVDVMLDSMPYEEYLQLFTEFVKFLNGLPIEKIRALARSTWWQVIYTSAKSSNQPLFDVPASEWDINKVMLVHWSEVYEKAREKYGDIPEHVWDNDELFDSFLARKAKQEKAQAKKANLR